MLQTFLLISIIYTGRNKQH